MEQKQQKTADNKALRKEITVYSEKYDIHGKVLDYVQTGRQILESYIENLSTKDRKVMLHNWYIEDHLSQRNGRYALAHGIVTGHTGSEWGSVPAGVVEQDFRKMFNHCKPQIMSAIIKISLWYRKGMLK